MFDYLIGVIGACILAVFGFLMKRNAALNDASAKRLRGDIVRLEHELENFETRLRLAPSRAEVRELLEDKLESIHLLLKEIKEDIRQR